MVRKTKSIGQALERLAPHMEKCGWTVEPLGGGKWEAAVWPTIEKYGVRIYKARELFAQLCWHMAVSHSRPEAVKEAVRWYGDFEAIARAQKIHHKHKQALRWLNIDEQYADAEMPEMPRQVYNEAGGASWE